MSTLYDTVLEEINNGIIKGLINQPVFYAIFDFESFIIDETLTRTDINQMVRLFRQRGFMTNIIGNKFHINWNSPQMTYPSFQSYDYNYNYYDWSQLLNTTYTAQDLYVRLLDANDFRQITPYNMKQDILRNISLRLYKDTKNYKDSRFYGINPETVINIYAETFNELAEKNIYCSVDNDGVILIELNVFKDDYVKYIKKYIELINI